MHKLSNGTHVSFQMFSSDRTLAFIKQVGFLVEDFLEMQIITVFSHYCNILLCSKQNKAAGLLPDGLFPVLLARCLSTVFVKNGHLELPSPCPSLVDLFLPPSEADFRFRN